MAFGLAGGIVQVVETAAALAYLQQLLTGLVSACQRLLAAVFRDLEAICGA